MEIFPLEKKRLYSDSNRTRYLCCPRRLRYLKTKCAGGAQKFEFIMNQHAKCSCSAYSLPEKNLHSDLITLANRKHKQRNSYDCFKVLRRKKTFEQQFFWERRQNKLERNRREIQPHLRAFTMTTTCSWTSIDPITKVGKENCCHKNVKIFF